MLKKCDVKLARMTRDILKTNLRLLSKPLSTYICNTLREVFIPFNDMDHNMDIYISYGSHIYVIHLERCLSNLMIWIIWIYIYHMDDISM